MSHAVVALATLILTTFLIAGLDSEVRKDNVKAGYIIIDKTAYKLVKAE